MHALLGMLPERHGTSHCGARIAQSDGDAPLATPEDAYMHENNDDNGSDVGTDSPARYAQHDSGASSACTGVGRLP